MSQPSWGSRAHSFSRYDHAAGPSTAGSTTSAFRRIEIRTSSGTGEASTHQSLLGMPDLTQTPARYSGAAAFDMAGVTREDIDVVEVYDSFTYTALVTIEELGFCKKGEGGPFLSNQRTAPGGDFPMNTNGGGLSYTHPGMYGIFAVVEAVRQLRHDYADTPERQVADARIGLAHGTGGVLSATGTVVLARE